jgi:hypothetical protein
VPAGKNNFKPFITYVYCSCCINANAIAAAIVQAASLAVLDAVVSAPLKATVLGAVVIAAIDTYRK